MWLEAGMALASNVAFDVAPHSDVANRWCGIHDLHPSPVKLLAE